MEKYGKYLENNPGLTINGKTLKDCGVGIAKASKCGGVYSDITLDHKTAGEAVAHNGLTMGASVEARLLATATLSSIPLGLVLVGTISAGTKATYATEQAYKHNFLGLKTGTDHVRKKVDQSITTVTNSLNPMKAF
ncbi:hypothetical protein [Staphylococcus caledonicus]|uniref:hypothetical protein n=1 Tax=Staphylococcus caledonicus TaxID=2741333 RepID=UPI001E6254D2|nr:hypothetical protein [Staphylococcus caledonicus]